ncbi:MAG: twin-arginine translocation signal domain-containing protein, partial [Cyclobacteriaceae bacterium]
MKPLSRRNFLSKSAAAGSYVAIAPMLSCVPSAIARSSADRLQLHVFSKHLQF